MKTIKIIIALILCILANTTQTFAQGNSSAPITIDGNIRTQLLNQYTDVFVSSPNSGTVIQEVHNDDDQIRYANSDRFFIYSQAASNYIELQQDNGSDIMTPGVGYVLQIGGNGNHAQTIVEPRIEQFLGSPNAGTITVPVSNGSFCLLGNPYNGFLNLDAFLMNPLNKTKVRGPILLWSHNTIVSANNDPSPDQSPLRFSANDYAMYNVLGGVAAGRSISTSQETNGFYSTGIQTPNGTICMGTGFGVRAIGTGVATFTPAMNGGNNGTAIQSFRAASATNTENTLEDEEKNTLSPPPPPGYRHRIWINMEEGFPPPPNTPSITPLRQLLIGYVGCVTNDANNPYSECATAGETDRIFDCRTVATLNPRMEFYSISNAPANPLAPLHLAIQGRSLTDYTDNDFFQLDYIAPVGGTYTFTTSSDGMFTTKKYYVLDAMASDPLLRNPFPYTFTTSSMDVPRRFRVVFESSTNLVNACGTQISSVWNTLFSNQISGATSYKYQVATNSSFSAGSIVGVFDGNVPANFRPYQFFLNIPGLIAYNTTYWIRVATYQVAGLGWAYGPICQIKTPSLPPTVRLTDDASGNCNKTVNNFNNTVFANSPNELGFTANGWRFEVRIGSPTGPTVGNIVEKTTNSGFSLALLRPTYQPLPGTVYYVRVQIRFGNAASGFVWQLDNLGNPNYGPTCTVTTTADATGRFAASSLQTTDFEANAYPNPFATNFKLDISTSSDSNIAVKVYDMVGRLIEERQVLVTEIDTQEVGDKYPTGVYTIVISQGENIKTLRVIKR